MENIVNKPMEQTQVEKLGSESFRLLKVTLPPRKKIIVETGAMSSMESQLKVETFFNQGFFQACLLKFLGGESFFVNYFYNLDSSPRQIYLTQSTPGEIIERDLKKDEIIYVQPGALIARSSQIKIQVVWAGFSSFFGGEGLFRLKLIGPGNLWYGCYGGFIEKEIVGDYIVDSGHLLSYPANMKLSLKIAGGWISSFLTREGIVLKISGNGKIQLQTRSIKGLAQWLNPRFWG